MPTGVAEFDRALGGGLVAGQVVLIGGDPGIGKSTLLLQALAWMGARAQGPLRERRGIRRSRSRSARDGCGVDAAAVALAAEISSSGSSRDAGSREARGRGDRLDPDALLGGAAVGAGLGGPGARVRGAADAARQDARHRTDLRRPRHQGGRARRPARARAHGRYRALLRGRHAFELSSRSARSRTASAR